ncbi:hypothetical protein [Rothia sp. P4278]|uniref:hypothetical protein n=1 Tax=Rothia sp. P4278 TaxID=3402658 RepID=UPI003AEBDA8C
MMNLKDVRKLSKIGAWITIGLTLTFVLILWGRASDGLVDGLLLQALGALLGIPLGMVLISSWLILRSKTPEYHFRFNRGAIVSCYAFSSFLIALLLGNPKRPLSGDVREIIIIIIFLALILSPQYCISFYYGNKVAPNEQDEVES